MEQSAMVWRVSNTLRGGRTLLLCVGFLVGSVDISGAQPVGLPGGMLVIQSAREGKYWAGGQNPCSCWQDSFSLDFSFVNSTACLPAYFVRGFTGQGYSEIFRDGIYEQQAEGKAKIRLLFFQMLSETQDIPLSYFASLDPISHYGLPTELEYKVWGLAFAAAAITHPNASGCGTTEIKSNIGDHRVEATAKDCQFDGMGAYDEMRIDKKFKVPLKWGYLGHRSTISDRTIPFPDANAVVWSAEFEIEFQSSGKWNAPMVQEGIYCFEGTITYGRSYMFACPITEWVWLHIPTFRKGGEHRILNPYGQGDVGLTVNIASEGLACVSSREWYRPHIVSFASFEPPSVEIEWGSVNSTVPLPQWVNDFGTAIEVVHHSEPLRSCLEIKHPRRRYPIPLGEYRVPLTVRFVDSGVEMKLEFTMRVHLPVEVVEEIGIHELQPWHGYVVGYNVMHWSPGQEYVYIDVEQLTELDFSWGAGVQVGVETKLGIGGNISAHFSSQKVQRDYRASHGTRYNPPPPGYRYVVMGAPRTNAMLLRCNHYGRSGYEYESLECFWEIQPEQVLTFRDGEVVPEDAVIVNLGVYAVPTNLPRETLRGYLRRSLGEPICTPTGY